MRAKRVHHEISYPRKRAPAVLHAPGAWRRGPGPRLQPGPADSPHLHLPWGAPPGLILKGPGPLGPAFESMQALSMPVHRKAEQALETVPVTERLLPGSSSSGHSLDLGEGTRWVWDTTQVVGCRAMLWGCSSTPECGLPPCGIVHSYASVRGPVSTGLCPRASLNVGLCRGVCVHVL